MLIICKKYPLSGLLSSEGTKDVTQGLIPAVADIKKIVWQSRVNEAKTIMKILIEHGCFRGPPV